MTIPPVFARPDRLHQFRVTAGAMADGLERRRWALADAEEDYGHRTEAAYEADTAGAADAVHAVALALRELGEWVGRVGDAFASVGGGFDGIRLASASELAGALPPGLRLTPADGGPGEGGEGGGSWASDVAGLGLTVARAAAGGLGRTDLQVLAMVVGRDGAGRLLHAAGESPRAVAVGRALDITAAARAGAAEAAHRWSVEPDRATAERGARAVLDGALTAGGGYGGSAAGTWLGGELCAASVVAVPICMSAGSRLGGLAGSAAGEWLSDRILGPEPEAWERDPTALADEVADVDDDAIDAATPALDEIAAAAADAADRHADFVVDHPWLWDDEYADAPHHDPPPPGPVQPVHGPA